MKNVSLVVETKEEVAECMCDLETGTDTSANRKGCDDDPAAREKAERAVREKGERASSEGNREREQRERRV